VEAADLTAQLLADREAGGVVGSTVDAEAGAEALHRLRDHAARLHQVAVRVERLDVRVDAKGHVGISLMSSRGDSMSPISTRFTGIRAQDLSAAGPRSDASARCAAAAARRRAAWAARRRRAARSSATTRWRQTATAQAHAAT